MSDTARNTKGLPRLVGYAELEKVYGWQKRALQRAVAAGKLHRPMIVAGGRAVWYDTDIKDYLSRLGGELDEVAVSDPNKLAAEPVENVVAKEMARQLGEDVDPDDVIFGVVRQLSKDDVETVVLSRWLGLWHALEERFGQLSRAESLAVVYGLFPSMRPFLDERARSCGRELLRAGMRPIDLALMVLGGPEGRELMEAKARR